MVSSQQKGGGDLRFDSNLLSIGKRFINHSTERRHDEKNIYSHGSFVGGNLVC